MASPQWDLNLGLGLTIPLPAAMAEQLRQHHQQHHQHQPPLPCISASASAPVLVPLRTRRLQSPFQSPLKSQLQSPLQSHSNSQLSCQPSPLLLHQTPYNLLKDIDKNQQNNDRNDSHNDDNNSHSHSHSNEVDETTKWEDVMQVLPPPNEDPTRSGINCNDNHDVSNNNNTVHDDKNDEMMTSHDNTDNNSIDNNEDDISMSPPPTLPLLLVDLQALCGFIPTTREEKRELEHQILMTLTQEEDQMISNINDTTIHDSNDNDDNNDRIAQYFHQQAAELLENQMAIHGDTSTTITDNLRYATIPYPDYLVTQGNTLVVTSQEWKRLLKPNKIPVVATIISHLVSCSQSLLWKFDMAKEIRQMAHHELHFQKQRNIAQQLLLWKTTTRKAQLDKLYQVRETFDHRLEVARQGLLILDDQLNLQIAQESRKKGHNEGWDAFNITDVAFPHNESTLLYNDDNKDHGDHGDHDHHHDNNITADATTTDDGSELHSDQEETHVQTQLPSMDVATLPSISKEARAKARRQATIKRRRRKLHQQDIAAKLELQEERLHQAMVEDERIRDMCTNQEYRMAQAVVKSLELRLQQVDDLLESLQEEEWADEEEGEQQEEQMFDDSPLPNECSVLDRILAMILGTLPTPPDTTPENHYCCIKTTHTSLVNQWESYFGRLPPMPSSRGSKIDVFDTIFEGTLALDVARLSLNPCQSSETTSEARAEAYKLRTILGIVDVNDEWDDLEELDMIVPPAATIQKIKPPLTSTTKSSLRPGGQVT